MSVTPPMDVHVLAVPNSRSAEVVGWEDDARAGRVLRVKVTAPPMEGKANAAIREVLAAHFKVPKSRVELVKGGTSRIKIFRVPGTS